MMTEGADTKLTTLYTWGNVEPKALIRDEVDMLQAVIHTLSVTDMYMKGANAMYS
jgi:hypothetical protein